MAKLTEDLRGRLRFFAFFLVNSGVQVGGMERVDYREHLKWPSTVEQAFAIWANVLELDAKGNVSNHDAAQHRVAQYLRRFVDPNYVVDPPFEEWEIELYM